MTAARLGLFGGTFDPIHVGHLALADSLAERCALDPVLFVVAYLPPHKASDEVAPFDHRLAMVELAVADRPAFRPSDIERELGGTSYTLQTVERLTQKGHERIVLMLGADALSEISGWHEVRALLARVDVAVASRPNARDPLAGLAGTLGEEQLARLRRGLHATPHIDVSSTDIRARVAAGQPIDGLVPDAVRAYIERERLYRD